MVLDQLENEIVVREMTNDDIEEASAIYKDCFGKSITPDSIDNEILYVAVLDDVVVGMCQVNYLRILFKEEKAAYINSVCVNKNYQHRGIAKIMLQKVLDICKSKGCNKSILTSASKKVYANMLYKSLGYKIYETNYYFKEL